MELKALAAYGAALALIITVLGAVVVTDVLGPGSDARAMLAFAFGLVAACALSSSLTFLIRLGHMLLGVSLLAALVIAGSILWGLTPLESAAKITFATAAGLWIALMLTSVGQVLMVSILIIIVDLYSVFLGPTKKLVESGGPWIDYVSIGLPVLGVNAESRLGISDIIFFSLFVGCALTFGLRRILTAMALTLSFVLTMIVGVTLNMGMPALPLLSIFFILANADLFYRRWRQKPGGPIGDGAGPESDPASEKGSGSTKTGSDP